MTNWLRPELIFVIFAAPCVGSFLGVLVERLPMGRPIIWSRSTCPTCDSRLEMRDLIPLVSWVVNRGRCRACHHQLSVFYPTIELLALLVAVWAFLVVPGWLAWVTCGLGWVLLTLAMIDLRHLVLPDFLSLPLVPVGLGIAWLLDADQLLDYGIGMVVGFAFLFAVGLVYQRVRGREGLGLGDAKLLAAAGAWLGWQGLPSVILIAAATGLAGSLLQARRAGGLDLARRVPFGPYLAFAFWLVWLYGPLGFN